MQVDCLRYTYKFIHEHRTENKYNNQQCRLLCARILLNQAENHIAIVKHFQLFSLLLY